MKELRCELCGDTNIIKQNGEFVCKGCGAKYSVEEVRNLLSIGIVEKPVHKDERTIDKDEQASESFEGRISSADIESKRSTTKDGKESTSKESQKRDKKSLHIILIISCSVIVLALALSIVLGIIKVHDTSQPLSTDNLPSRIIPIVQAPAFAGAEPLLLKNGMTIIEPDYEQLCQFRITCWNAKCYYVYLQYLGEPDHSTISPRLQKDTKTLCPLSDFSFIVEGHSMISVYVPIGKYKLYYAIGDSFYNTDMLFGDSTKCYTSQENINFYAFYNASATVEYSSVSIALDWSSKNAEEISISEFPKGGISQYDEMKNAGFDSGYTIVLDKDGGTGGTETLTVNYLSPMPTAKAPRKTGYIFKGYFSERSGQGTQYYNEYMSRVHKWDQNHASTIYAFWEREVEQEFSLGVDIGTYVYADIDSIVPFFGVHDESGVDFNSLVCCCTTPDNSSVWVLIPSDSYSLIFASAASETYIDNYPTYSFPAPYRFHGIVVDAESVSLGLSVTTGSPIIKLIE